MCIYAGESRAEVGKLEKVHNGEKNRTCDVDMEREGQRNEGSNGEQPTKVNTTSKPVTLDTN